MGLRFMMTLPFLPAGKGEEKELTGARPRTGRNGRSGARV
jgi:hypothetical protein